MLRGRQTDLKLVADRTVGGLPLPYADTNFRYTGSAPKARAAAKAMRSHLGLLQDLRDDIGRSLTPRRAARRLPLIGPLLATAALFDWPTVPYHGFFPGYSLTLTCPVPPQVQILAGTKCGLVVVTNRPGVTGRPRQISEFGPIEGVYNEYFDVRRMARIWTRPFSDPMPGAKIRTVRPHVRVDTRFAVPTIAKVGLALSDWPEDSRGAEPSRPAPQRNREVRVSGGRVTTITRSDVARRPPRAEKERKVRVALGASSIPGQIVAAMTEGIDVAQAFFRALTDAQRSQFWREQAARNRAAKKDCVRRNTTRKGVAACYAALPQTGTIRDKLAFVARHFDTMDMSRVINEIVLMNAEDGWWGRIGKLEGVAAARRGQLTGGDFGARDMEPVTDDRTVVSGGEQIALREWLRRKYGE